MGKVTRIGSAVWDWEEFIPLSPESRNTVWALLTTAEVKRLMPGLWHGGIQALAEASKASFDSVTASLTELVDRELVEWDRRSRVLRLTKFPDKSERADNGRCILGWWTAFKTVPECRVRNDHIELIRWLCDPFTKDHQWAWDKSFGTVSLTVSKPRVSGVGRRPEAQLDLLSSPPPEIPYAIPYPIPIGSGSGSVSGSGSGSGSSQSALVHSPDSPDDSASADVTLTEYLAELDPSGPVTELRENATKMPFTVRDLVETLSRTSAGRFLAAFDPRLATPVTAAIRAAGEAGFALADVETLGAYFAAGASSWRDELGASWAAKAGNLVEALGRARAWAEAGRPAVGQDRFGGRGGQRGPLGVISGGRVDPPPNDAFHGGRRKL